MADETVDEARARMRQCLGSPRGYFDRLEPYMKALRAARAAETALYETLHETEPHDD